MCKIEYGFSNFKKLGFVKKATLYLLQYCQSTEERELEKASPGGNWGSETEKIR